MTTTVHLHIDRLVIHGASAAHAASLRQQWVTAVQAELQRQLSGPDGAARLSRLIGLDGRAALRQPVPSTGPQAVTPAEALVRSLTGECGRSQTPEAGR